MIIGISFWILFLGLVAGISVALPYGPVGFVIIRRFYLFGIKSGMYSAFGSSLSDAFYAIVVGFGLHRIQNFLLSISSYAEVFAGIVLLYIGARAIKHKMHLHEDEEENHPVQDVTSTLLLNFLNPTLIFFFCSYFHDSCEDSSWDTDDY
jgi:threonine/homoserine/homoserine lactone efflux protein